MRWLNVIGFVLFLFLAGAGPDVHSSQLKTKPETRLEPGSFRCILVGDSQTTDSTAARIRTQMHRWDMPVVGELLTVGNSSTGYIVNNGNGGSDSLVYSLRDPVPGWGDYGPHDFFATNGAQWTCLGDVQLPGSRIGRYLINFGPSNVDSPWNTPWGVGQRLVAQIAIRTSPNSVDSVETRPERGGVVYSAARRIHYLPQSWGVQLIEQPIEVSINPDGLTAGVSIYLPDGQVEVGGEKLEILGVVIKRVDFNGRTPSGSIIGYMGRWGWSMYDHINRLTAPSRDALIKMIDPDYVMILLGHNMENGGSSTLVKHTQELSQLWEDSFAAAGRGSPSFIYVVPWSISGDSSNAYISLVSNAFHQQAAQKRTSIVVNMYQRYGYLRPDVYDPSRYQLDSAGVHPGDIPTAINLSEDLYQMLFFPNRLAD